MTGPKEAMPYGTTGPKEAVPYGTTDPTEDMLYGTIGPKEDMPNRMTGPKEAMPHDMTVHDEKKINHKFTEEHKPQSNGSVNGSIKMKHSPKQPLSPQAIR